MRVRHALMRNSDCARMASFIFATNDQKKNQKNCKNSEGNKQKGKEGKLRKKRKGKTNPTVVHNISLMHVRPLRACEQSEMNERMNEWHA